MITMTIEWVLPCGHTFRRSVTTRKDCLPYEVTDMLANRLAYAAGDYAAQHECEPPTTSTEETITLPLNPKENRT
jgi:hypothetical protein